MKAKEFRNAVTGIKKGDWMQVICKPVLKGYKNGEEVFEAEEVFAEVSVINDCVSYKQNNYKGMYWKQAENQEQFDIETLADGYAYRGFVNLITKPEIKREKTFKFEDIESMVVIPRKAMNFYDKIYDYANLNSESDDCIWDAINKYKATRELTAEQRLFLYDIVASRMGWKYQEGSKMTSKQMQYYAEGKGFKWIGKNRRELWQVQNLKTRVITQATTLQVLKRMIDEQCQ